MNDMLILNEVRRRIVKATNINPATELKILGKIFDIAGKSRWVEETMPGGEISAMTNFRISCSALLIQYNFYCPAGSSMDEINKLSRKALDEFSDENHGEIIKVTGYDIIVKKLKIERSEGTHWNAVKLLMTLNVSVCS